MLRFPNPGSNIDSIVRIYKELFLELNNKSSFHLDDISETLVKRNLATSCGYMGKEALSRSTRSDRSRDPLYNQSKMYSEIYKILGWIHPKKSALNFKFTYLGAHVIESIQDPFSIFKESVLGISYPNEILDVRGELRLRPFSTILRTMNALDNRICRDEIIIGPLSLEDDRDEILFTNMIEEIKHIRGKIFSLINKLNDVSEKRNISINTMRNYTRFPIGVLKWMDWVTDIRQRDVYNRSMIFLLLTEKGKEINHFIDLSKDLRASDLKGIDEYIKTAIVRIAFYEMLERAGFVINEEINNQIKADKLNAANVLADNKPLLFSPFQELHPSYLSSIFPEVSGKKISKNDFLKQVNKNKIKIPTILTSKVTITRSKNKIIRYDNKLIKSFKESANKFNNITSKVVKEKYSLYERTNKKKFYPLVSNLFKILGYYCKLSRSGVNYQRWDAIIIDDVNSIPIEIKSPGEEIFISVKAVRQALENKIILLSRKQFATQQQTTSLVVGYNLPNDRSEVNTLIYDIYNAFNIVIGIIDFKSLLHIVAKTINEGKNHNKDELIHLLGFIDVSDS